MSVNIKDSTKPNSLNQVAGNISGDVLNTLEQIEANTKDTAIAGALSVKELAKRNVYSTDEVVIGTWMGKPLYRKVVIDTVPYTDTRGNAVEKNISVASLNPDVMVSSSSFFHTKDNQYMTCPLMTNSLNGIIKVHYEGNSKAIRCINSVEVFSNCTLYVICEYTKTTD